MKENLPIYLFAAYALAAVVCFGPATVQSERAQEEYRARCRAEKAGDKDGLVWCDVGGPSKSDGLPKAMFWPFWLSYMLANK